METKEIISDFKESFLERIKNPFVLLYIISWLAWNWLLVYEIFSFPNTYTLESKVKIINDYVQEHFCGNLTIWPAISALLGAIIFIIFSAIFLFIFSWFQRTLKPMIYQYTAQDDNIPRYLYDSLHKRHDTLKRTLDESKKVWIELDGEKNSLDEKIAILEEEKGKLILESRKFEQEYKDIAKEFEGNKSTKERANNLFRDIFMNEQFWYITSEFDSKITLKQLRFDKSNNVYNQDNVIEYQIRDIQLIGEEQIIQFKLYDNSNLKLFKTHFLYNLGGGNYSGLEISSNGLKSNIKYSITKPPQLQ